MQMYKDSYWIERSILYTSRTFDNLNRGAKYSTVLPVIHVGFLNYDLFPEHPKFYATYQLTDTKSGKFMMEQTVCRFRFAETVCVGNILEKQDITVVTSSVFLW